MTSKSPDNEHPAASPSHIAMNLDVNTTEGAEAELNRLKNQNLSVQRFVEWHENHDPHLLIDVDDAQTVLDELSRSTQQRPPRHILSRECLSRNKELKQWKGHNGKYENWMAARAGEQTLIPYIPSPAQLRAMRYLEPRTEAFPEHSRILLREVDLEWYIDGKDASP